MDEARMFNDFELETDAVAAEVFNDHVPAVASATKCTPRRKHGNSNRILIISMGLFAVWILGSQLLTISFGGGVIAAVGGLWIALNGTILADAAIVAWRSH